MARPTLKSLSPAIFAAVAFTLSWFAGIWCHFVQFTSTSGTSSTSPITVNFGIWYYQGYQVVDSPVQGTVVLQTCNQYPSGTNIDAAWRSARAFSTMTLIIGGIVTFFALLSGFLYPSSTSYKSGGLAFLLCCLFQGLSLLLLDSNACNYNEMIDDLEKSFNDSNSIHLDFEETCSLGPGAKCAIASTVFWFVAGVAALKVEPPRRGEITQQTQDVTYTRTVGEDGTAVVEEHVVKGEPVPVSSGQADV
mmetsp:Transcript_22324/g.46932  ORF Transcript_22324/g.46932 Transcript_22324/m.46932 type:complete len:249 (-) Transcript_22324:302-1048(-)|eukprot:CAMPEP_0171355698 /NCGR_PEP_ID=MMETSP0878-20121228/45352_1 /TAXON_ID=67004 /ORGANISM="Thalassiosira weissflogii, Strain CCMP1336" /LENGTH=248 /DNA_ID=CAMNT_0011861705 /DNA_START=119 /DNA_END=865 /DNA_ORIENTATION=+